MDSECLGERKEQTKQRDKQSHWIFVVNDNCLGHRCNNQGVFESQPKKNKPGIKSTIKGCDRRSKTRNFHTTRTVVRRSSTLLALLLFKQKSHLLELRRKVALERSDHPTTLVIRLYRSPAVSIHLFAFFQL